jgi:hypothetical protein
MQVVTFATFDWLLIGVLLQRFFLDNTISGRWEKSTNCHVFSPSFSNGFQEIVEEGLKYGENTSEYSSNRKFNVNDEGHLGFDTATDDILCITLPLF